MKQTMGLVVSKIKNTIAGDGLLTNFYSRDLKTFINNIAVFGNDIKVGDLLIGNLIITPKIVNGKAAVYTNKEGIEKPSMVRVFKPTKIYSKA